KMPTCLSPELFDYTTARLSIFQLSNLLGSELIDAYVGLITDQKVQTEIYILSYLLKGRVYHGDLWELAGERCIEAQQEETLRRHQSICNGTGRSHAAAERYLMDERKKRCQLEVSLYSQAIEIIEQFRIPKHEIRTPSAAWRHSGPPLARTPLACVPLACSISTQRTCEACSGKNDPYFNSVNSSHGYGWMPSAPLPCPHAQQEKPTFAILNVSSHTSLPLLSTWVTPDVWNAFDDAFRTELDMQSELMTKSLSTRRSNAYLRNSVLDLLILHSKMRRAQAEIKLYTLAIDNICVSDCSDLSEQYSTVFNFTADVFTGSYSSWDENFRTSLPTGDASSYDDDLFDADVEDPINLNWDPDDCPDDSENCVLS
ncbi:hypothetical protein P692DRAFT_20753621, partial [Suillus brevipes Sb2]